MAKEELLELVHDFGERLDGEMAHYDLIHSHYWLSGMVGRRLKARHAIPMVHTMHTMARVKNNTLSEHQTSEPNDREHGEAAIVADADVLTANTPDEAAELQQHYGATTDQIRIVPPGVDLHTFHPCDQPQNRAQLGVDQEKQIILFVGRIQPLKAPDVLIRAVAELAERDPGRRDRLRLIIIGSPSGPDSEWSATLTPLAARPRRRRPGHLPAPLPPRRPVPLVLRGRRGRRAVLQRVLRPGGPGGAGLRPTGRGHRRGRAAAHRTRPGHRAAGSRPGRPRPGRPPSARCWTTRPSGVRMGARAAAHASSFSWDNTAAATLAAYGVALDQSD